METNAEKECSALGGLFQLIISELKGGTPVWEDFLGKAAKLHSQMKATVLTSAAFLDSFQKVADMATNTRGATKDIGTALTRLCLRHRSVEAKLKTFSSSILDNLVLPLQDKLEEWKKVAYQMDKDHAKEYKRVRQEIKKKSSDTLRLQKKVRKGKGDAQKTLDTAMQDVSERYHLLEETEKQAVRRALIEERGRYCMFVACLKPVVEAELAMLHEITHLQEVLDALTKLTEDPQTLPSASEQVIIDVKGSDSMWSFQTPPSSPTSLGSRKSSMCSISSLNSSSSGSTKSHSPSHHRCRSLSQPPAGALRLSSVSSQDSGFTSQDTLFTRLPTPPPVELTNQGSEFATGSAGITNTSGAASSTFPPAPCVTATWPNLQDTLQFERAAASILKCQRPHTISTAYERAGHNRPALTAQTFQPLGQDLQQGNSGTSNSVDTLTSTSEESSSYEPSPEDAASDRRQKGQMELSSDGSPCTPTHIIPPLLPERSTSKMQQSHPLLPDKPSSFKGQLLYPTSSKTRGASGSSGSAFSPIYANTSDLLNILEGSESFPAPPPPLHEEKRGKVSYRKDLAVILTQSLFMQQQQQIRCHSYDRQLSDPGESTPSASGYSCTRDNEECEDWKGVPIQSSSLDNKGNIQGRNGSYSSKPPPPVRRTSSLSVSSASTLHTESGRSVQQMSVGEAISGHLDSARHHKVKDSCNDPGTKDGSVSSGWTSEPENSAAIHAQLIQVLNARLSGIHHHPEPGKHEQDDLSKLQSPEIIEQSKTLIGTHQRQDKIRDLSVDRGSVSDHSTSQSHQPHVQTAKKPARAHSISGNEREAFMKTLNAKFAQTQQTAQQTLKKSSVQEPSSQRYNKYATSPRSINQTASRRCSQPNIPLCQLQANEAEPIFAQIEDKPITPVTAPVEERSSKKNFLDALNARLAQQQDKKTKVDRRSSLNLEHEIGRSYVTNISGQATLPARSHSRSHRISQRERIDFDDSTFNPMMSDAAARVHNWLASRGSVDVSSCRESLMGQIRQGIPLRKAPSNDRSAPRF